MYRLAAFIVEKRYLFFLLYVFAILFCLFSMNWVMVENDVTTYLPGDTETRQGLTVMNENFVTFASARVMVSNVTFGTAEEISGVIEGIPGVDRVEFDSSGEHYKDAAALYDVSFTGETADKESIEAVEEIREKLSAYDLYIDTLVGYDENALLRQEMNTILAVGVVIIIVVLVLTSRAYAEVPVLMITFGVAALLNMGTNFLCGKISFISDSIASVLQLALAIDYAIILCHRFSDEHETRPVREACVHALAKAIPEISASSATTISGLAALSFMKFGIGMDMAVVLIKAILFSLLTVFTLMPGLLVAFCPLIDRTRHRRLLPDITLVGKFAVKGRFIIPLLFAVVLAGAFFLSSQCPYCYGYNDLRTAKMTERQNDYFKIKETFGVGNMLALVVPAGSYESERAVLRELETRPEVKKAMGLANTEATEGIMLTDALTPRELSELGGMDYEVTQAVYGAYAVANDQYGQILGGLEGYRIPLFDLLLYLKDNMEDYHIVLEAQEQEEIDGLFAQLESAVLQLRGQRYSRMVVYLNLPEEGEETFAFLEEIRRILGGYYGEDYYVIGNSTSSRDLSSAFVTDNLRISVLSALFVIVVLLFTFQSAALPVLLISVIQGSIWINFSFPAVTGPPLYFLGYLIVNAIQMGANIDYAIVISSHYQEKRVLMPSRQAIVEALNASFPTVFTSGGIMVASGLLIGNLSAQPVVSIMGVCLGRGTIISIFLVLCVLPAILVLGDTVIERTGFRLRGIDLNVQTAEGTLHVHGHVRGHVSGIIDAEVSGLVHGKINAAVSTDGEIREAGKGEDEDA